VCVIMEQPHVQRCGWLANCVYVHTPDRWLTVLLPCGARRVICSENYRQRALAVKHGSDTAFIHHQPLPQGVRTGNLEAAGALAGDAP